MTLIYIAKERAGDLIKIGCSRGPAQRVKQLRSPSGDRVVLLDEYDPRGFWFTVERRSHERLAHRAVGGEWFRATRQEALWAIYSADKDHDRWVSGIGEAEPMTLAGLTTHRVVFRRKDGITYERDLPISEWRFHGRHY